jgi:glutaredoxin
MSPIRISGRLGLRPNAVSDTHTLFVCHIDEGGPPPHACKRAARALRASGHDFEKIVFDRGHLFGLFTTGRRPKLKEISGQEQLPVLVLSGGTVISGSKNIINWARSHTAASAGPR